MVASCLRSVDHYFHFYDINVLPAICSGRSSSVFSEALEQLMTTFALACSVRGSDLGDTKAGMVGWVLSRPCYMLCFLHLWKVASNAYSCQEVESC